MAFDGTNMSMMGVGAFRTHMYRTTADAKAAVDSAGYFNDHAAFCTVGDVILVEASDDTGWMYVSANDGSTVDVNDLVTVRGSDTD
jgi:hypothetical protein